jgi:hypothetical protein
MKKKELELLSGVKEKLLEKGFLSIGAINPCEYKLIINANEWHKIFKTDEYNEMKNS